MKKFLGIGLILLVQIVALHACKGAKAVRLYDPSEIQPAEIARVMVPYDIEVVSVDSKKIGGFTNILTSPENEIHLAPGEHEIIVLYSDFWEYNEDHFEKYRSKKVVLNFRAEPGRYYRLAHPKLSRMRDAENFAENPDFWIEEVEKCEVVSTAKEDDSDRVYEAEPVREPFPEEEAGKLSDRQNESPGDDWDSLSEEEKKKFREWMKKRDGE
ncbi:MAG: DUF2057 family protein [Acidobacteria bacterium]|nr:DUF2057 family protein [Acidobacteriota bacterium]